eukprot:3753737-Heterocapsa_arctica.AAC.1
MATSTTGRREGEGWWSSPTWMALCRHCGGRHLHKDCPKAPPPGLAGGRPAAKAAPMPRPGKGKGKGKG